MEARFNRVIPAMTLLVCLSLSAAVPSRAIGANYRTANFTVSAPTPALAKEIGDAAEIWRKELANQWLGQEMPSWSRPCPISARVAPNMGAGGKTSFTFDGGEVFGWDMSIQGSRERILDSVLPHEITHTVFASHFRKPLPRWADEGACTTVEHQSEVAKQERMLIDFLKTRRGISFSQMFAMKEYPQDVMPLYSQGHSVSQWLIESRGRRAFLEFLNDGMNDENWPRAVERHFGFANLGLMQESWLEWVKSGRPHLSPDSSLITQQLSRRGGVALVSGPAESNPESSPPAVAIYRGQSPDDITPIPAPRREVAAEPAVASTISAEGSIYALASTRAAEDRRQALDGVKPAAPSSGKSIYDAIRETGVIRR